MDTATTAWQHDPFFQYPRTTVPTSEGPVDLPILYYDDSVLMALFSVDHERARAQVTDAGLEVVRLAGGHGLVVIAFYQYRRTSIAAYNEVGVAIAVVPAGTPAPRLPLLSLFNRPDRTPLGFHVIDLPVTTAAACAAGREIWGYPKFVTPIAFSLHGRDFDATIADPDSGGTLARLAGRLAPGLPAPLIDPVLYSRHAGHLLRTAVNTRGGAQACLPGTLRLDVPDAAHPMARRLQALGLAGARPALAFYSHRLQLRLNAGAVIG